MPRPSASSLLALAGLSAALAAVGPASAAPQPVRGSVGELTIPRVTIGPIRVPPAQTRGRARVIVTLGLPPLAAALLPERSSLATSRAARRLDVSAVSSRAYLARIDVEQRRAIAALRRAIPEARVGARYRIVLNGLTVSVPMHRLPALLRLGFARKVYPSLRYAASLNRGPAIIGATALQAATGARGEGLKVAVVHYGIEP